MIFLGVEPDLSTILDQGALILEPMINETSGYVAKISGFIVAPYTGDFEFYIAASDKVALFISNTTDPNDATVIAASAGPISLEERGEKSMAISLEGKKICYSKTSQMSDFGTDQNTAIWESAISNAQYRPPFKVELKLTFF